MFKKYKIITIIILSIFLISFSVLAKTDSFNNKTLDKTLNVNGNFTGTINIIKKDNCLNKEEMIGSGFIENKVNPVFTNGIRGGTNTGQIINSSGQLVGDINNTNSTSTNFSVTNITSTNSIVTNATNTNLVILEDLTVDTNTLYVDSDNNRVGIGTITTPTEFYIENTGVVEARIKSLSYNGIAGWSAQDNEGHRITMAKFATGTVYGNFSNHDAGLINNEGRLILVSNGNDPIVFFTDEDDSQDYTATEKMRLKANGNLGIGTTSPETELHVNGTTTIEGYMNLGRIHHAYGGIIATSVTVALTNDTWAHVTNADGNLFSGDEADGMSLVNDEMMFEHSGDYTGLLTVSISGGNGNDYEFRFYDTTATQQLGSTVYKSTGGANNYESVTLPIYFEIIAGDIIQLQVRNLTDNDDVVIKSAVFLITYLHD